MAMENCLVGSPPKVVLPQRHTAKYDPSIWGDTFISHVSDKATHREWREKAETLKGEVQKMLSSDLEDHGLPRSTCTKLNLIDAIQRLGVAYHFEDEIEEELGRIFHDECRTDVGDEDTNLRTVALTFRLLREHRYNLTCDVFKKFLDNKGNFKKSFCEDVHGLLSLYEATYLRVQGETILDNALTFTAISLKSLLPHLSPLLANQVLRALYRPLRKTLPRLETRKYITVYEQIEGHSEILLGFAKLDFNILQKLHQEELCTISKWWKELDVLNNFPFARDRVVECYFWMFVLYTEPEYSMARTFLTKLIAVTSIIDDMYDNYGTNEELELFTSAIQRMEASAIVDLPEYMKLCYRALLDVYDEAENDMMRQGKPIYGVQSAKEAMKRLTRAYFEERTWLDRQDLPTLEEYKNVSFVSTGYPMLSVASVVFMGDVANEETFNWLLTIPKIVEAASAVCRLMDDIVSHNFEQERAHPPSGIECYMAQYGSSEEEACDVFRGEVEEAWKDINRAFLRPTHVDKSVLMRVLNLARVVDFLHKESDGYTHVTPVVKECITSLLVRIVQV